MRKSAASIALVFAFALVCSGIGDARQATQRVQATPTPSDRIVQIDETSASGAIKVTGRSFVNAANDVYNNMATTRWNRTRFVRLTGYTSGAITFQVQGITGGAVQLGVVVNNVPFASVPITVTDAVPRWYTVTGMTVGAKTVDLVEEFQDRVSNQNSGLDGRVSGTYLTNVALPTGFGGSITKVTARNVIAVFGDSHVDGDADNPSGVNGWAGQLRRAALANGNWTTVYVGAGSSTLCGDGPTYTETAAMVHDGWVQSGAVNKYFLMMRRPNDYAYYGGVGGGTYTPTQYQAYLVGMFAALDVSDPGWTGILTRIPQGSGWGANGGGFTRADYWAATVAASTSGGRTNVQTFDMTVFTTAGLDLAVPAQWFEADPVQVHMRQPAHDIVAPIVKGWYGL